MSVEIVGRVAELAEVDRFLDGVRAGPAVLALEGSAGIGKTTVWRVGVGKAEERSYRVLACRPGESEAKLSFAALGDLLERVLEDTLPQLPLPQRRALEVALLREEPGSAPPDQRAISTAFLGAVRILAAASPVVLAIDDGQWLDAPTQDVLKYAVRRLRDERVGVLMTIRSERSVSSSLFGQTLPESSVVRLNLGPLTLGAIHRLVRTRANVALTRPTLRRLEEISGGVPFFVLEIVRALERTTDDPVGGTLPVPHSLRDLLSERLGLIPPREREILLAAAALSQPSLAVIGRALGGAEIETRDYAVAERLEVVELVGERLRFTHPLVASVLYAETPLRERRSMHRRIAAAVADPEERARHLALAAVSPAAEVAAELDRATDAAVARGAVNAAAELAALACELTPPERLDDVQERRLRLGEILFRIGDANRARNVLEQTLDAGACGSLRARAFLLMGRIAYTTRSFTAAVELCERALDSAAEGERLLRAEIHATLSWFCDYDARRKGVHARLALELLGQEQALEPRLLAAALRALAESEFFLGRGIDLDVVERAIELERAAPPSRVAERTERWLAVALRIADDLDGSRVRLEHLYRAALEEGDESSLSHLRMHLALAEAEAGNLRIGETHAAEALELADMTGQEIDRAWALSVSADIDIQLGREGQARAKLVEVLAFAERIDDVFLVGLQHSILGSLEFALGDITAAEHHLAIGHAVSEKAGIDEPGLLPFLPDYIETLIELDELAAAERLTRWLEVRGSALDRHRALARSARCRSLLFAATGDLDAALAACERALAEHDGLPMPYELARTLLVLGEIRRRRKERGLARSTLDHALEIFDGLGARFWSERTKAELQRLGGRRPGGPELTPTEERIAELAARGLTNREVAAAAFVSAKTVEANLSRAYRKLGIRSRAELGIKMAERQSKATKPEGTARF